STPPPRHGKSSTNSRRRKSSSSPTTRVPNCGSRKPPARKADAGCGGQAAPGEPARPVGAVRADVGGGLRRHPLDARGGGHRPPGEHPGEMTPVLGGGGQVVDR